MPGNCPKSGPAAGSRGPASVMFVRVLLFMLAAVRYFGHEGWGAAVVALGGSLVALVGVCICIALRCLNGRGGHEGRGLTGRCGGRLAGA